MPVDLSTRRTPIPLWPETDPSWQCTKCGAVFPHMNLARLHLRVKHKFRLFTARAEAIERCIVPSTHVAPPSVYKHSAGVLAGWAYAVGRLQDEVAIRSHHALTILSNSEDAQSLSPTIALLIGAARHRRPLITLASTLEGRDREFVSALTRDEEEIMKAIVSMSETDRLEISRVTGQEAADILNLLDMVLHPASPSDSDGLSFKVSPSECDPDLERSLQRVFVRLCESSLQLPHRLWLSQVHLTERQPVDGGSYGEIYMGTYAGRSVALKSLRVLRHREDNAKHQKAFYREVAIVRGIDHQHVCPIIGVDRDSLSGVTCVVLPWMEYGNVLQYLAKVGWSPEDAVRLIHQVASGLAYLHDQGVVHGDLHVGNILVDADKNIHLADFGLANFADAAMSCSSAQPGATRCMAPEIFDPVRFRLPRVQHTPASDVYSFGQVSWQIYTGEIPFSDLGNYQAMFAILDGKSQDRSVSERPIPNALWGILQDCWYFEPAQRAEISSLSQRLENLDIPRLLDPRRSSPTPEADRAIEQPEQHEDAIPDLTDDEQLSGGAELFGEQIDLVSCEVKDIIPGKSPKSHLALATARSTEAWLQDLRTLLHQAKDYFPDVVWQSGDGKEIETGHSTDVWGHSAIVSSRASADFHKNYFTSILSPNSGSLARIVDCDTLLLGRELQYLYTAEGTTDSFNSPVDGQGRLDKLRGELTFMWQSGLKSDARVIVSMAQDQQSNGLADVTHHVHRFLIAARSPYFLDRLKGSHPLEESNGAVTIRLPSPPFSPPTLHLVLGWIYSGTLDLSERSLNLETTLSLLRGAVYLGLDTMYDEVQAYIVEEMMHGLFAAYAPFDEYETLAGGAWAAGGCTCRRCARRTPRILELVRKYEPKNEVLERGAQRALVAHFGEGWCSKDFADLPEATRRAALKGLAERTVPLNVFALLYASQAGMKQLGEVKGSWVTVCREMLLGAVDKIDQVLCAEAVECFRQQEWLEIVDTYVDNVEQDQKFEWIIDAIQRGMGDESAAVLYQILRQTLMTYPDTNPYVQIHVERTYQDILRWIRGRWKQVWQAGGFNGVEPWVKSEILRDIDTDDEDLRKILKEPYAESQTFIR
ncbi:BTB/POZ domain-containing protein [Phanerochaete sordida]|uniref:BTB/POZ domain-containing protein n=1 Tax=Phanerochaete sordida TaxID=48140 RepID=A0A9P3GBW9_9APHY|nr:BTB/POZ domain-containing protein [Phanerochaete sordida]